MKRNKASQPPGTSAPSPEAKRALKKAFAALPFSGPWADITARDWIINIVVDDTLRYYEPCAELEIYRSHPRFRIAGKARAQKSIDRFVASAERLLASFHAMPRNSVEAIMAEAGAPLSVLGLALNIVLPGAKRASQRIGKFSGAGRPTNDLARDVAENVAKSFEFFTGKKAAPGRNRINGEPNEFEKLLSSVYSALNIVASAEDQAKDLRRREKTTNIKS